MGLDTLTCPNCGTGNLTMYETDTIENNSFIIYQNFYKCDSCHKKFSLNGIVVLTKLLSLMFSGVIIGIFLYNYLYEISLASSGFMLMLNYLTALCVIFFAYLTIVLLRKFIKSTLREVI